MLSNYLLSTAGSSLYMQVTNLYLISKLTNWNFLLTQIRHIILIERMRKLVTKIISNRLSNICTTHNILQDPNYASLKNKFTDILIHLLNFIIEEAKNNNNEL